jgi:hypothetical protein
VCVVRFIHSICPSDDDQYTGHRDIEGEGGDDDNNEEEDDLVNTSFHLIEEEASPKIVNFEEGQSICLSLYFKSSQYSAEHVCQIVLESPIKGWQVSSHEELFTTATYLCKEECTYKTLCMCCFGKAKDCTKFTSTVINEDN